MKQAACNINKLERDSVNQVIIFVLIDKLTDKPQ